MELNSIELFCLAAEHASFTGAARAASVTPAAVSRSVSRLEERLGVRLFVRTTRQVRLTEPGRIYFEQCRRALGLIDEAESEISGEQAAPAGMVRISVPTPYAHHRLLPRLAAFRLRYPQVHVEVHVSNRNIDFADEDYDLAIRGREPAAQTLVARKLEDAELVLAAAPSYLKRAGKPKKLEDLHRHDCIQFELPRTGRPIPWIFMVNGAPLDVFTSGGSTITDDIMGVVSLARAGGGLIQTYRFILERDLADGSLVELLPQFGGTSRPFYLIYPGARHQPLRVRVLVDFLVK